MQILFHDDFDGAASAALLTVLLGNGSQQYTPVDFDHALGWDQDVPTVVRSPVANTYGAEAFAVVDFLYHPAASVYFDHHLTSFGKNDEWRSDYLSRAQGGDEWCVWDDSPSCAELIWRNLPVTLQRVYAPVKDAANRIDRARFGSVEEFYQAAEPETQLQHAWGYLSLSQKRAVIRALTLPSLAVAAEVARQEIAQAMADNLSALDEVADHMELRGDVVLVDSVRAGIPFQRFAPYYYYPQARYALTVYAAGPDIRIGLGKNPWIEFEHHDLGRLARGVGGGGHSFAAGAMFSSSDHVVPYSAAWNFMARTARTLNQPVAQAVA